MTAHIGSPSGLHSGSMSIDGTPISESDLARIHAEEKLHLEQQVSAVRVVAASSVDTEDCRTLLAMLGLEQSVVARSRGTGVTAPPATGAKRARKRRAAA